MWYSVTVYILIMRVFLRHGLFCHHWESRLRWNSGHGLLLQLVCTGVNLTWLDTGMAQINYCHQCWHRAMFVQLLAGTALTYQTNRTFIPKPQSPWHFTAGMLCNAGVHYWAVIHSTWLVWISDALEELMFSSSPNQFSACFKCLQCALIKLITVFQLIRRTSC